MLHLDRLISAESGRTDLYLRRAASHKALRQWHPTFAAMQAAVAEVLDHLEAYRDELSTLMVEQFHIIEKAEIPVEYREVA